jgi:hypothetical protein
LFGILLYLPSTKGNAASKKSQQDQEADPDLGFSSSLVADAFSLGLKLLPAPLPSKALLALWDVPDKKIWRVSFFPLLSIF